MAIRAQVKNGGLRLQNWWDKDSEDRFGAGVEVAEDQVSSRFYRPFERTEVEMMELGLKLNLSLSEWSLFFSPFVDFKFPSFYRVGAECRSFNARERGAFDDWWCKAKLESECH